MIRSFLYLTASRVDIMLSICLYARYQSNPKESYLKTVKRIFQNLLDTEDLGLWHLRNEYFDLLGYSDANFTGCKLDRKNTIGACHFHDQCLVS